MCPAFQLEGRLTTNCHRTAVQVVTCCNDVHGTMDKATADHQFLWATSKETSDTNGRVTATDPVNTAVPDL